MSMQERALCILERFEAKRPSLTGAKTVRILWPLSEQM